MNLIDGNNTLNDCSGKGYFRNDNNDDTIDFAREPEKGSTSTTLNGEVKGYKPTS